MVITLDSHTWGWRKAPELAAQAGVVVALDIGDQGGVPIIAITPMTVIAEGRTPSQLLAQQRTQGNAEHWQR